LLFKSRSKFQKTKPNVPLACHWWLKLLPLGNHIIGSLTSPSATPHDGIPFFHLELQTSISIETQFIH
jgi:hypothetical protein